MPSIDVSDIARRHGFSAAAAEVVLQSLRNSRGGAAQFDHPELGGSGQWMPGMVQIGDMFNTSLKARVDALCAELAAGVQSVATEPGSGSATSAKAGTGGAASSWWPATLGRPDTAGGQNDLAYAFFAGPRRLALRRSGDVTLYDTGPHRISGVAQSQAGGDQRLSFSTSGGTVDLASLPQVGQ